MKLNSWIKIILSAIAIISIWVGVGKAIKEIPHEEQVMRGLQFRTNINGNEMSFTPWEASVEGMYYLVLPTGCFKNELTCTVGYNDQFYLIYIDDKKYNNGETWRENLQEDVHKIKIMDRLGRVYVEKPFQILLSEDVPSILVTVEAKEELYNEKDYANKQYVEKGNVVIIDKLGNVVLNTAMERFKVRGNLTSTFEKKPFTFTLPQSISLFGMSESNNWHLLANAGDGSHIRNKIMLDWAEEITQAYQPNGEWIDLFINGEYQGLYFLTETIEISKSRVDIDSFNSIFMEMEISERAVKEENYLKTEREHYWVIYNETRLQDDELREIEFYLNDIESALYSKDGKSEISGHKLSEMMDFDSWTDAWLLEEISADHDLGVTSQFAIVENWKEKSILLAGPAWDFDITMGNAMIPLAENPRNLMAAIPNTRGIESVSQNRWLSQMYQNEEFKELLVLKFKEDVQPKINRLLEYEIDSYVEQIRRSALLDSLRWNGNGINRCFSIPEGYCLGNESDYHKYDVLEQHVNMLKHFLKEKEQFLNELWVEKVEFEVIIEEHNEEGMNLELNNDIYTWIRKDS